MIVATLVALASALLAALCAAADGALLAAGGGGPPTTGASEGTTLPHGDPRNHAHRSLSIARTILHLTTGIAGAFALGLNEGRMTAAPLVALLLALTIVLLSEAAPRAYGERRGPSLLRSIGPSVRLIERTVSPLASVGAIFDRRLLALVPAANPRPDHEAAASSDPFHLVFHTQTQLPAVRRDILRRYSSLGDTEIQELMVPRVDIIGIERETPWSEVVDRVRSSQHARVPVYADTLDQITGVLFAKDILPAVIEGVEPAGGWATKVRPATFIPEGKSAEAQLRDFKTTHHHLAIVVDEYGGTAGLVTIEDVLEEIVGDIRDENDREEPPIKSEDGRRFWISGKVTLDELSEALGHPFALEDVTTVGGLVFHLLGHVPKPGEQTETEGFRMTVERVVRRRVDRVFIEPAAGAAAEDE